LRREAFRRNVDQIPKVEGGLGGYQNLIACFLDWTNVHR